MTATVELFADAGERAGLGHVARCSALASALRAHGLSHRCIGLGLDHDLELDGIGWSPGTLSSVVAPATVLDSYTVDRGELADRPALVQFRDDASEAGDDRAIVVSPFREEAPDDGRRLFGTRYACLRVGFWGLPARTITNAVDRVLVTTGGMDIDGHGSRLAQLARDALPSARVTLVRGPYSEAEALPGVANLQAPETLLHELLATDLVLTGAGQTMLEAAATGTPCVAVPLAENQELGASTLHRAGVVAAVSAGEPAALADELERLGRDLDERRRMAASGQGAVDGFGALRIAWLIAREVRGRGRGCE